MRSTSLINAPIHFLASSSSSSSFTTSFTTSSFTTFSGSCSSLSLVYAYLHFCPSPLLYRFLLTRRPLMSRVRIARLITQLLFGRHVLLSFLWDLHFHDAATPQAPYHQLIDLRRGLHAGPSTLNQTVFFFFRSCRYPCILLSSWVCPGDTSHDQDRKLDPKMYACSACFFICG